MWMKLGRHNYDSRRHGLFCFSLFAPRSVAPSRTHALRCAHIVAEFQHHGACSDENREEGLSRDDREVLLSHDAGLPDEQEDCGGGGHHPVEAAAQQDCRVRDALDEAHPARARARHLAEAAGGGAREAHGLRARGVGDQDRRDRGGPRDHRAAGTPEHAAAAGSGAAGGSRDGGVLQAAGGRVPGQQEQGQAALIVARLWCALHGVLQQISKTKTACHDFCSYVPCGNGMVEIFLFQLSV